MAYLFLTLISFNKKIVDHIFANQSLKTRFLSQYLDLFDAKLDQISKEQVLASVTRGSMDNQVLNLRTFSGTLHQSS